MSAELLLTRALEREWLVQSGGGAPLAITPPVREAVELATAGGALAIAGRLREEAPTAGALVDRVRDVLVDDPWGLRLLGRLETVPPALPPSPPPLPELSPPRLPALRPPAELTTYAEPVEDPPPSPAAGQGAPQGHRWWRRRHHRPQPPAGTE
jgi:hypothetical protein